jgi:hypothetical protein
VLPGKISRPCTDPELADPFQRGEDVCAQFRSAIDLLCGLGPSPCDINPFAKAACETYERITGKPFPLTKPEECNEPEPVFYERCIVANVIGERETLPCTLGTNEEIREQYRRWRDQKKK